MRRHGASMDFDNIFMQKKHYTHSQHVIYFVVNVFKLGHP